MQPLHPPLGEGTSRDKQSHHYLIIELAFTAKVPIFFGQMTFWVPWSYFITFRWFYEPYLLPPPISWNDVLTSNSPMNVQELPDCICSWSWLVLLKLNQFNLNNQGHIITPELSWSIHKPTQSGPQLPLDGANSRESGMENKESGRHPAMTGLPEPERQQATAISNVVCLV